MPEIETLAEGWRVHCSVDRGSLQPIEIGSAPMKKVSDQQNKNGNTQPSFPERRTFVKGITAMGAGVAAFPVAQ
jgi:hypothetical protein